MESGDAERLKYAALELRMAMESLTYDRALAYKEEFPPAEYETWQPRKVMAVLLDIDPTADKDSSLAFGIEPSYGEKPDVMHSLGTEKVLSMSTLKKHYDALGSYLHVLAMSRRRAGIAINYDKMRTRCEYIAGYLREVLASPVWNSTFGTFATIDCQKCGKPVRKRLPQGVDCTKATCFECGASYVVRDVGENQAHFEPDQVELHCANNGCETAIYPWRSEIAPGVGWTCDVCGGENIVQLGISHTPKGPAAAVASPAEAHE